MWRGGTDTFVVNLVKGLDKNKYDITVVLSICDEWLAERENEVLNAGAKTVRTWGVTGKGLKGRVKHLIRLYKYLRKEKPDVFQTNIDLFNGPNLFVAWMAGVPIRICHSHNSMQEREVAGGKNILVSIYQVSMRWMCWTFSNRRAGCSEAALDFLFKDKWKTDPKAIVVNNGIDLASFRTGVDRRKKEKEIGASKRYHILTVGRISAQKNPIYIINIFNELCKIRDDCDLVWAGIGEMENQVQKIALENGILDKVHLLGIRDDVNELMQSSDLLLFPSVFEGLGIVVVEAQAAGLPCIISDTIPPMVQCGGCEFLSIKESEKYWAEKISKQLDCGTIKIDEKKLKNYSIDHMVEQMESLFQ